MSKDGKILEFPKQGESPPCPVEIESKHNFCRHPKIKLVEHERCVMCVSCGASLDAYAYLQGEAWAIRRGWQDYQYVRSQLAEAQEKLDGIKKEIKRNQAALKRLKDKTAHEETVDLRKPL